MGRYNGTMRTIVQRLRRAVRKSKKTRYRLAKDAGLAQSALCRLMKRERGLSIEAAVSLADALGWELVLRRKRKRKVRR